MTSHAVRFEDGLEGKLIQDSLDGWPRDGSLARASSVNLKTGRSPMLRKIARNLIADALEISRAGTVSATADILFPPNLTHHAVAWCELASSAQLPRR